MAAKMIGAFDKTVLQRVIEFTKDQENSVLEKAEKLERIGFKNYLENAE